VLLVKFVDPAERCPKLQRRKEADLLRFMRYTGKPVGREAPVLRAFNETQVILRTPKQGILLKPCPTIQNVNFQ